MNDETRIPLFTLHNADGKDLRRKLAAFRVLFARDACLSARGTFGCTDGALAFLNRDYPATIKNRAVMIDLGSEVAKALLGTPGLVLVLS